MTILHHAFYIFSLSCLVRRIASKIDAFNVNNRISPSNHTKNVAILIQSSPYFHNYRHTSNVLSIYQALKKFGNFTDDNIILMLVEEIPYNARNTQKGTMVALYSSISEIWDDRIEIDYTGSDVSVNTLFQILLGRFKDMTSTSPSHTAAIRRYLPQMDETTNVLLYMTGHGGNSFFKFRDYEEFSTQDLIHIFSHMRILKRFHEILFVSDTCQADTLSPHHGELDHERTVQNVYSVASSRLGQYSYSHHSNDEVGVSVVDRYTYEFVKYMDQKSRWENMYQLSLKEAFVDSMYIRPFSSGSLQSKSILGADVGWSDVGCRRTLEQVPLSDFMVMRQQESKLDRIGKQRGTKEVKDENDNVNGLRLLHQKVSFNVGP